MSSKPDIGNPEFDRYSASYENLLKDPIRDRFAGAADFFHRRKQDLIRQYFRLRHADSRQMRYLDVGFGKGEMLTLLSGDFAYAAGCDPSGEMVKSIDAAEVRVQHDPEQIPFDDAQFDFITAVCVYHHVPPASRKALTGEIVRLLRPGGVFAIIEHDPWNPATRIMVSRTPVDSEAILLRAAETRSLLRNAGLTVDEECYFLYLPEKLYRAAPRLEDLMRKVPLGGQYAVFARHSGRNPR